MRLYYLIFTVLFFASCSKAQTQDLSVITGAEQTGDYFPLLYGNNVALVANQTSTIGQTHIVDTLLSFGINVEKVLSPEHGFRGTADAGQKVDDGKDEKTGIPIISLYGKHKKPTKTDLQGIDIVVFDIQDVGVRFYTYISTLHYVMETCAELDIPILVLDRPNPNGFYVDGPVLDTSARSFVGMHPVPLVHGMTIAEYALMINGEGWLIDKLQCNLMVLPCNNYDHNTRYKLPVKPSPNLPNIRSVLLYPSLGLFEGTIMSVGRGTTFPFQVYGHPDYKDGIFKFTPQSIEGAKHPKYNNQICRGNDLRTIPLETFYLKGKVNLEYLIASYQYNKLNPDFFNNFFYRLAGTKELRNQIENGMDAQSIRASWQYEINNFIKIREKYLLYSDFD